MKYVLPTLFIALSIGTYYVFINPEYKKITALRATEQRYIQAQAESEELADTYDRLATEYNNLSQSDIAKLDTFLPDTLDTTRFAMNIDAVAAKYGIKIREITITNPTSNSVTEESKPFVTNLVNFKFKSPYPNFVQFMRDLEQSLQLMDVTQVSFATTDNGIYDFGISLQTYSLSPSVTPQ